MTVQIVPSISLKVSGVPVSSDGSSGDATAFLAAMVDLAGPGAAADTPVPAETAQPEGPDSPEYPVLLWPEAETAWQATAWPLLEVGHDAAGDVKTDPLFPDATETALPDMSDASPREGDESLPSDGQDALPASGVDVTLQDAPPESQPAMDGAWLPVGIAAWKQAGSDAVSLKATQGRQALADTATLPGREAPKPEANRLAFVTVPPVPEVPSQSPAVTAGMSALEGLIAASPKKPETPEPGHVQAVAARLSPAAMFARPDAVREVAQQAGPQASLTGPQPLLATPAWPAALGLAGPGNPESGGVVEPSDPRVVASPLVATEPTLVIAPTSDKDLKQQPLQALQDPQSKIILPATEETSFLEGHVAKHRGPQKAIEPLADAMSPLSPEVQAPKAADESKVASGSPALNPIAPATGASGTPGQRKFPATDWLPLADPARPDPDLPLPSGPSKDVLLAEKPAPFRPLPPEAKARPAATIANMLPDGQAPVPQELRDRHWVTVREVAVPPPGSPKSDIAATRPVAEAPPGVWPAPPKLAIAVPLLRPEAGAAAEPASDAEPAATQEAAESAKDQPASPRSAGATAGMATLAPPITAAVDAGSSPQSAFSVNDPTMTFPASGLSPQEFPKTDVAGPTARPEAHGASVSQQVATAVLSGPASSFELLLSPEELGQVRIDIKRDGDATSVAVAAERPETLDLLRRHADLLIQDMKASGQSEVSLSFGKWGGSGRNDGGGDHSGHGIQPAEPELAPVQIARAYRAAVPESGLYLRI